MTNEEKQRAKEKAEELVYKFIEKELVNTYYFDDELWLEVYSSEIEFQNAKQCALIAVDEILNNDGFTENDIYLTEFWQEVKKQIKEMK